MRFVKLKENEIPRAKKFSCKLDAELAEFMAMNCKCVRVTFTELEYKSANSAYSSITKALQRNAVPVRAFTQKGQLYLRRPDLD